MLWEIFFQLTLCAMARSVPLVVDRALRLLEAIISDRGASSISSIAARLHMPSATAYRLSGALVERGYIVRVGAGRYYPGSVILAAGALRDARATLRCTAKPWLDWLARKVQAAAHLGVFEGGMVSYLVKSGSSRSARFTREGTQLDAYCSALGKVLLAHLPASERNAYLAGGPFPKLTSQTITDPRELGIQLRRVRKQSYAIDDREFAEEVVCIAVPVRDRNSRVYAALSITTSPEELRGSRAAAALRLLRRAASDIARCMDDQGRALRESGAKRAGGGRAR